MANEDASRAAQKLTGRPAEEVADAFEIAAARGHYQDGTAHMPGARERLMGIARRIGIGPLLDRLAGLPPDLHGEGMKGEDQK